MHKSLLVAALIALPTPAVAQKKSEKAIVMQQVAGVDVTVEYHRPVARGREKLFGGVVKWDEVWTPGANNATTLEISADINLNGNPVPKGKYSLWMIPAEAGEWTVFLNNKAARWHTEKPKDTTDDIVRFKVKSEAAPHLEMLTFTFPSVTRDGVTLRMQWGDIAIPLEIAIPPREVKPSGAAAR